jgi:GT2 family glycosyltransferase
MPQNYVAVVMPVWNNWYYTKKAIQYLSKLPNTHKLIIVDNGSTDNTSRLQSSNDLIVIHNTENLGFAKGCNTGYACAKKMGFRYVLFLNNDIRVFDKLDSWTEPLIDRAEEGAIVGPTVGCLDDSLNFICEAPKFPSRGHGYLSGWCIMAKTETWEKLSTDDELFSTEFGLAYFEDTDLSFRARKQSIPLETTSVPIKHLGKATSKQLGISDLYLKAKSIFLKKWKDNV